MATYIVSDIHGAFDEFHKLLDKVEFCYDGSDELYLLGDYADWGAKSMETLLFVKDLDERYSFVHCLRGNHEQMFLDTIESGYDNVTSNETAHNWLYANKGMVTWNAFMGMTQAEQVSLAVWMQGLPFSMDVRMNGQWYMLAHAYPYYYDARYNEHESYARSHDSLWRRLMVRENPFKDYEGDRVYHKLICGHTITDIYFQESRYEKDWPMKRTTQTVRNHVFFGEHFIDIDCGAKCMDLDADGGDIFRMAALRAQLACLRLEDEVPFYVHRNLTDLPEIHEYIVSSAGKISMPEFKMPDLNLPEVKLPDMKLPDMKLPDMKLPDMKLPEMRLPSIDELLGGGKDE